MYPRLTSPTAKLATAAVIALVVTSCGPVSPAGAQNLPRVRVAGPGQLDWKSAVPEVFYSDTEDYKAQQQSYEFFQPQGAAQRNPQLLLFVSPTNNPVGWHFFRQACRQSGLMFVGPARAGNNVPIAKRIRIVLDVLDDIRSRTNIPPERTYIAGFSGGATVARMIAYALPEEFAGLVVIGATAELPDQAAAIERIRARLSVAMICGEREPVAPIIELAHGPIHKELGIRSHFHLMKKRGHVMPTDALLTQVAEWLLTGATNLQDQEPLEPGVLAESRARAYQRLSVAKLKGTAAAMQQNYAVKAAAYWNQVLQLEEDPQRKEAIRSEISKLRELAEAEPPRATDETWRSVRLNLTGKFTRRDALTRMEKSLGRLGFDFEFAPGVLDKESLDESIELSFNAATIKTALQAILKESGLKYVRAESTIRVLADE